jgi:glycosyltransferase involved in cell wall biosynthesis
VICDVVIPALDERPSIRALLEAIEPHRAAGVRHVVVADNGSTDGTPDEAEDCGAVVVHEPQRGYGAACLAALAWIGETDPPPDAVVFIDADLSDDPAGLPDLLAPLDDGTADLVIGSRVRRAEPGALNFVQRFGNGLACVMMGVLSGRRYSDLGPFRAVRWSTLDRLQMADRTWGWTVEMQMKAALLDTVDVTAGARRSPAPCVAW